MYKSQIIKENKLYFNKNIFYNEDRLFVLEYILKCSENIYYNNSKMYHLTLREDSATGKKTYSKKMDTEFTAFDIMENILKNTQYDKVNELIDYNRYLGYCDKYIRLNERKFKKNINFWNFIRILNYKELTVKEKYAVVKRYIRKLLKWI